MNNERIAKILLQGKVDGTRRRGKPRTAWMSAVEERTGIDLHRATELAQDRDKWGKIAENVGAHVRPKKSEVFSQGTEAGGARNSKDDLIFSFRLFHCVKPILICE